MTNGNGFVDNNSEQLQQRHQIRQSQISPVILSSNASSAHVMRSRLNQFRANNVIVCFDENATEATTTVEKDIKGNRKKKKNSNYVADI